VEISLRILYDFSGNAAGILGLRSDAAANSVGTPMQNAIASHMADEHFVIRLDGRIKSHHHRFIDALREGLSLRDQFPLHTVKVCAETDDRRTLNIAN
jgi:hypothetical protein